MMLDVLAYMRANLTKGYPFSAKRVDKEDVDAFSHIPHCKKATNRLKIDTRWLQQPGYIPTRLGPPTEV